MASNELLKELFDRAIDAPHRYGANFIVLESYAWQDVSRAAAAAASSIGRGRPNLDQLTKLATTARAAAADHTGEFAANLNRIAEIADELAAA